MKKINFFFCTKFTSFYVWIVEVCVFFCEFMINDTLLLVHIITIIKCYKISTIIRYYCNYVEVIIKFYINYIPMQYLNKKRCAT